MDLSQLWRFLPAPMQEKLSAYVTGFWSLLPNLVFAALFLILVWIAARLVSWLLPKALRKARVRTALVQVVRMIAVAVIWLFGLLIAATIAVPSVTVAKIFAAAGIGGLAIAFAAKDTLENFFAGIMLLAKEPFRKRDFIECEGIVGQVEEITIRETYIRRTDGQIVVAPNAMFFSNPVRVMTAGDLRRITIICGVAYGEDVDEARDVIARAVKAVDDVRDDVKDVQIFAQEFAESSINFEVTWWTGSTPLDERRSKDKVVSAVKRALDEAGIEIPFPYRTLTFKEPLPLRRDRDADDDRVAAE